MYTTPMSPEPPRALFWTKTNGQNDFFLFFLPLSPFLFFSSAPLFFIFPQAAIIEGARLSTLPSPPNTIVYCMIYTPGIPPTSIRLLVVTKPTERFIYSCRIFTLNRALFCMFKKCCPFLYSDLLYRSVPRLLEHTVHFFMVWRINSKYIYCLPQTEIYKLILLFSFSLLDYVFPFRN